MKNSTKIALIVIIVLVIAAAVYAIATRTTDKFFASDEVSEPQAELASEPTEAPADPVEPADSYAVPAPTGYSVG